MGYDGDGEDDDSRSTWSQEVSQAELGLCPPTNRRKPSIASKVSQTIRDVRRTLKEQKDFMFDFDKYEDEKPPEVRYIPERLDTLCMQTGMDRSQMRSLYRAFKKDCPSGAITEIKFRNIYCQLFPIGDGNAYAHYIFKSLDKDEVGRLTFGDFVRGLASIANGSVHDKLTWIFRLYDIDHDGEISREELSAVIGAIHDLMGPSDALSEKHTDLAFKKFDLNSDGVITIDEFMTSCFNDEVMCSSFSVFDGFW
ncbi:UNVERIFIED_CONTAM: hypothetical protein PYX00_005290 [Menopon gallinae]|uniref:EF-hand domain-containing protein n=1 Tax=Menopon gallinae TaxID=328185 RepID=A0AAW2HRY0_9NEOP